MRASLRASVCLVSFLLSSLFFHVTPIQLAAYADEEPNYFRGPNYETWTYPTYTKWNTAPQAVWDGSHWVAYVLHDRYAPEGRYVVQTGLVAAEVYDYYIKVFSPDLSEVRLYDERWEVQRWKNGKWLDIGAQSGTPTFRIAEYADGVNITKAFHSWAGWLNITYAFQESLKHMATWKSEIAGNESFRVSQRWSGIVGDRVKHQHGVDIISGVTTLNSSWFMFQQKDTLTVYENQLSMMPYLQPVIIDVHAQGMKCSFIFGDWTLTAGDALTVDPDTATLQPSTQDAEWGTMATREAAIFKFDISSIPAGYDIASAIFKIYVDGRATGSPDNWDGDMRLKNVNSQTWSEGDGSLTTTASNTTSYSSGYDTTGWVNKSVLNIVKYDYANGHDNCTIMMEDADASISGTNLDQQTATELYIGDHGVTNRYCTVRSREHAATSTRPMLVILYSHTPSIGEFSTSASVYANEWFSLATRINDVDGVADFANATVELTGDLILKWDASEGFSKHQDPQRYCDFSGDASEKLSVNSTAYELKWVIKLSNDCPEGGKDVVDSNTAVSDSAGLQGSNSQLGLFTFQHAPSQEEEGSSGSSGGVPPSEPPIEPIPPITPSPLPPEEPGVNLVLLGGAVFGAIIVVSAVTQKRKRGLSRSRRSWKSARAKKKNPKFPKGKPKKVRRKKREKDWKWSRK